VTPSRTWSPAAGSGQPRKASTCPTLRGGEMGFRPPPGTDGTDQFRAQSRRIRVDSRTTAGRRARPPWLNLAMRLLVLGGTVFLGRAVVEAALARGDDVTFFTRGRTNPELCPGAERLHGDRDGDLSALAGREWDVVVDTCGYVPRVVADSATLLSPAVGHYAFVSSLSVYADASRPQHEDDPLEQLDDEADESIEEYYGALKGACEQVVQQTFPGRSLLVRPGLIVGPHDPTNRFTYWVRRIAEGGDVLAPGDPARKVQFIDVRDLAEWILRATEAGLDGPHNAVGPEPPVTMGDLLETCVRITGS